MGVILNRKRFDDMFSSNLFFVNERKKYIGGIIKKHCDKWEEVNESEKSNYIWNI